jgi:signal transduction histidine kinase
MPVTMSPLFLVLLLLLPSLAAAGAWWLWHRPSPALQPALGLLTQQSPPGEPLHTPPGGGQAAGPGPARQHAPQQPQAQQQQRLQTLGRLTGGVTHDLNNLLGVISNSLYLIERHANSPAQDSSIAAIRRSVQTGSLLTQHLLRFAAPPGVQPMRLNLVHWLPELLGLWRTVLGRHLECSVRVEAGTAVLWVDADALELVLTNLALDARDAMPAGGRLRLSAGPARPDDTLGLPGAPPGPFVVITVSDEGPGQALGQTDHTASASAHQMADQAPESAAAGWWHVQDFCRCAGGRARRDSTPGLGTAVSLLLPAAVSPDQTPPA